jgi:hypothetical protein
MEQVIHGGHLGRKEMFAVFVLWSASCWMEIRKIEALEFFLSCDWNPHPRYDRNSLAPGECSISRDTKCQATHNVLDKLEVNSLNEIK